MWTNVETVAHTLDISYEVNIDNIWYRTKCLERAKDMKCYLQKHIAPQAICDDPPSPWQAARGICILWDYVSIHCKSKFVRIGLAHLCARSPIRGSQWPKDRVSHTLVNDITHQPPSQFTSNRCYRDGRAAEICNVMVPWCSDPSLCWCHNSGASGPINSKSNLLGLSCGADVQRHGHLHIGPIRGGRWAKRYIPTPWECRNSASTRLIQTSHQTKSVWGIVMDSRYVASLLIAQQVPEKF